MNSCIQIEGVDNSAINSKVENSQPPFFGLLADTKVHAGGNFGQRHPFVWYIPQSIWDTNLAQTPNVNNIKYLTSTVTYPLFWWIQFCAVVQKRDEKWLTSKYRRQCRYSPNIYRRAPLCRLWVDGRFLFNCHHVDCALYVRARCGICTINIKLFITVYCIALRHNFNFIMSS